MTRTVCRTATADEVSLMLDWAAVEGWNPGIDDASAFYAADPDGFFVALDNDRPVACISVVNHSDNFAFLGLYICKPDYRGHGVGFDLWRHAIAHAGDRTIGLDGVPAQQDNYARSGFTPAGRTSRYSGTLPRMDPTGSGEAPWPSLAALDFEANGFARPAFLAHWTANSATRKTVVQTNGDAVVGFATARLCREGCKIGPVIAPSAQIAYELSVRAAAALDQTAAFIDLPEAASDFAALLAGKGFTVGFTTARMYRGPAPVTAPTLQAIATMELG